MKKVFFVQVGFDFDGSVYLPCAAGALIAYAKQFEEINARYSFESIIFRREPLAQALRKIKNPYLVAFSCAVWNIEYNKALARLIKEKYPDCHINFGGHSVSEECGLLETEPYIDSLMFGEGEEPFTALLRALPGNLQAVNNLAFRGEGGRTVFTPRAYYDNIDRYPSAYLCGVYEKILAENPDTSFLAVLETNRGCPYSCAYCDWCAGKKMRFFPLEKVKAEIDWLAAHKIEYCFCADSNFGMFERDVEIADYLIASKKRCGYPQVFRPCYEKNSAERVFQICAALNSVQMDKGATLAYQTLSDEALKNIGRKNLTMEHFASLMQMYNGANIPTYSELILGLPGETKESFCQGLCKLLESGQHNSVSVYYCEILPNSELARKENLERFGIEVIKVPFNHIHSAIKQEEEVQEYSYLVRSTASMSREDWVESNLFSVCLQSFHSLGILRFFAMYLHEKQGVSYFAFYSALLAFLTQSEGKLQNLFASFREKYENSFAGDWNYHSQKFGNITWFFEEGAFLEMVTDLEATFRELLPFLQRFAVPEPLFEELLQYQKAMVRKPFEHEKTYHFQYDFYAFFDEVIKTNKGSLKKQSTRFTLTPGKTFESMEQFAKETVWFGRRRGASVYGADEIHNTEIKM